MSFVQAAYPEVKCSRGTFRLEGVAELNTTVSRGLSPVKTMNRLNRVRGHRGGPAEVTGSLSIPKTIVAEAPFFELCQDEEVFLFEYEEGPGGGERFQLTGFQIDELSDGYNAEGEATLEVSFVATSKQKVPA